MSLATLAAACGLLVAATLVARAALGARRIPLLADSPPLAPAACPALTFVVAARDEAAGVEAGLRTLLAQDHPRTTLIAVDDRSSDGTGEILDRLAATDPRLEAVHVRALPPGWLGKCHALALGAARARGEWILFTDADVLLEPTAARRALALAAELGLDHVTAGPTVAARGFWLPLQLAGFVTLFGLYLASWRARDPRRRATIGIGAFNLVRASAYRAIGGHQALRLFPDDDLELGRRLKRAGFRQALVGGRGTVAVEWYPTLAAAARGLEKNVFAGFGFSLPLAAAGIAWLALVHVAPWPLAAAAGGLASALWAASAALQTAAAVSACARTRLPWWAGLGFPLGVALHLAITVRAIAKNLVEGGIRWRGTFYPLAELRRARARAGVTIPGR